MVKAFRLLQMADSTQLPPPVPTSVHYHTEGLVCPLPSRSHPSYYLQYPHGLHYHQNRRHPGNVRLRLAVTTKEPPSQVKTPTSPPPGPLPSAFYPSTASSQYLPSTKHDHHHPYNPTKTYLAHRRGARVAALPRRPL